MTVLITGAAGFLGVNLTLHLARRGLGIVALVREPPDAEVLEFLGSAGEYVEFAVGDVCEREGVIALVRRTGVTRIIHAAALTPTPEQERDAPAAVIDTNLMGTVNVLEAARLCAVTRVVYVSSDAVYGAPRDLTTPMREEHPPHPANLYGISKLASEQIGQRYAEIHGLSVVSGRLGTLYGPMERPTDARLRMSTVYHLMRWAIAGTPIAVCGLDYARDYVYVGDAVEAFTRLLDCAAPPWSVYNVASGTSHSLREILSILRQLEPTFQWRESTTEAAADLAVRATQARPPLALARLTRTTGFVPQHTLDAGLRAYHEAMRDRHECLL